MTSNYSERPRLTLHRPLLCMVASSRPRSGRGGRTQVRKMFVRSSSGPRPAVADWLSEVVPDWLADVMRPKKAPVPWADMTRAVFAIWVPLAAGFITGHKEIALLPAMG